MGRSKASHRVSMCACMVFFFFAVSGLEVTAVWSCEAARVCICLCIDLRDLSAGRGGAAQKRVHQQTNDSHCTDNRGQQLAWINHIDLGFISPGESSVTHTRRRTAHITLTLWKSSEGSAFVKEEKEDAKIAKIFSLNHVLAFWFCVEPWHRLHAGLYALFLSSLCPHLSCLGHALLRVCACAQPLRGTAV